MKKTESKTLDDGVKITVTQHPCTESAALGTKLAPVVLPLINELDGLSMDAPAEKLIPALSEMVKELSGIDSLWLMIELFRYSQVEYDRGGKRVHISLDSKAVIDEAFDLKMLVQAIWFSLTVNYLGSLPAGVIGSGVTASVDP